MIWPGEEDAWNSLVHLDHQRVVENSSARYLPDSSTYSLTCFNQQVHTSLIDRQFHSFTDTGTFLIDALGNYSRLSILHYLLHASWQPFTGHLVKPHELPGGRIFEKGTHVLPLPRLIGSYGNHPHTFFAAGKELGATELEYGDMAISLNPFPKIEVVLILWQGDDEFPPRGTLLFDSSCSFHLPLDIIWSTAMMTVGMMLSFSPLSSEVSPIFDGG